MSDPAATTPEQQPAALAPVHADDENKGIVQWTRWLIWFLIR